MLSVLLQEPWALYTPYNTQYYQIKLLPGNTFDKHANFNVDENTIFIEVFDGKRIK
jgi:hypothetical protein